MPSSRSPPPLTANKPSTSSARTAISGPSSCRTIAHAQYMTYPRACAMAEVTWSDPKQKNWTDFRRRLDAQLLRLKAQGVHYRQPRPDDDVRASSGSYWFIGWVGQTFCLPRPFGNKADKNVCPTYSSNQSR